VDSSPYIPQLQTLNVGVGDRLFTINFFRGVQKTSFILAFDLLTMFFAASRWLCTANFLTCQRSVLSCWNLIHYYKCTRTSTGQLISQF